MMKNLHFKNPSTCDYVTQMLSQIDPPAVCHVKIAALPAPLVLKVGTYCPFPFFEESIYASP